MRLDLIAYDPWVRRPTSEWWMSEYPLFLGGPLDSHSTEIRRQFGIPVDADTFEVPTRLGEFRYRLQTLRACSGDLAPGIPRVDVRRRIFVCGDIDHVPRVSLTRLDRVMTWKINQILVVLTN